MNFYRRINNKLHRTKTNLLFCLGLEKKLLTSAAGKGRIIMYHGVDKNGNKNFSLKYISISNFEKQLRYFKENFNIISVSDFFENKIDKSKINIALTFDDGYLNNYKYVFPLIEKYKVPVTFFITALNAAPYNILWADCIDIGATLTEKNIEFNGQTFVKKSDGRYYDEKSGISLKKNMKQNGFRYKTGIIDVLRKYVDFKENPLLFDYWKLMSDDNIREISRSEYVTVGAHGFYHNNLGNIGFEEAKKEITESKKYLENLTCKEINTISYPDGSYNKEIINFAESIGLKYHLAVEYLYQEDKNNNRIKDRFGMYPAVSWQNQIYDMIKSI